MKKHAYFIGIDNGGSAIKAAVFNENGRELSVSQVQIPMDHPNPGWTERDPHAVWRGNCQVIRDAIGKAQICAQNIKGVSVSVSYTHLDVYKRQNVLLLSSS